jgi:putative membrane protein insertion efficiency factor
MPALLQRLKRPELWLAGLLCVSLLALADAYRRPDVQLTARVWVSGVRTYQRFGRPLLEGRVKCRYRPTCSEYSAQAVSRYGIRQGLALTVARIRSCKTDVPMGSYSPVP